MQLYSNPSPPPEAGQFHIPAMGIHEIMPPGLVKHGGAGTYYPCLLMIFHTPAWVLTVSGEKIQAGHCFVVWGSGAQHHYGHDRREWNHSWLQVTGRNAGRMLAKSGVPQGVPLPLGGGRTALRYWQLLCDELRGGVRQDTDLLEGLLQLVWLDLRRRVNASAPPPEDERLARARDYIEANFVKPFDLSRSAAVACLSPAYFCHRFARQFGVPPREYAMRLRLQRGAQLLANSSLAVYQVAEMVGCSDALYFSRLFRNRYGVSPAAYRGAKMAAKVKSAGL